eukprot:Skav230288  [mRNA]  locus=scaffold2934:22586:24107:- [translate_table: standard]
MSNIDVNDAFAKRMAQVQAELQQMQKVQNELKGSEARYLKAVQGTSGTSATGRHLADQLHFRRAEDAVFCQELDHCNEEIRELEKKKEEPCINCIKMQGTTWVWHDVFATLGLLTTSRLSRDVNRQTRAVKFACFDQ